MHEVSVERSVVDGIETLRVRITGDRPTEGFLYVRPVGRDAWFHAVDTVPTRESTGQTVHVDHAMQTDQSTQPNRAVSGDDPRVRGAVERVLVDRGYPIRARDGTTPPAGFLQMLTETGTCARAFHSHPSTFVVHQETGPSPDRQPTGDTVHVAVLEQREEAISVRVDAVGGPPPETAIREAVLAPCATAPRSADLPVVRVEN